LKGAGGFKSFFNVASDRIKSKYERDVFSVANLNYQFYTT